MSRFNEKKYNELIEQLEISILPMSFIAKQKVDRSMRIDAEFYQKQYLNSYRELVKKSAVNLISVTKRIDVGFVGSMVSEYREDGDVVLLQTQNIDSFFLNLTGAKRIGKAFHDTLAKSQVHFKEILIARSGSFGKASIYLERGEINSSDIIIVKADENKISPYYLVTYLNSKFGVEQFFRFASGGLQGHVNLTILENLLVPIFSRKFQESVEAIVKSAYDRTVQSNKIFQNTEEKLLQELKLTKWIPSVANTAIKKFSDFTLTGRLDAEYYQLKYDELLSFLRKGKHLYLDEIVDFKKSIEPGSDAYQIEGIPFIRVSDLSKFGITAPDHHLNRAQFDIGDLKPKKDTILLTKDGSVGIAYKVDKDLDVITSGALLHLELKNDEVLPDYLTLVLNSKLTQMQAERDAGGSIIQHWRPEEIKKVVIPILPMTTQKELVKQIRNSFKLREDCESLIEKAKHAVELAIEKDENAALKFIG